MDTIKEMNRVNKKAQFLYCAFLFIRIRPVDE